MDFLRETYTRMKKTSILLYLNEPQQLYCDQYLNKLDFVTFPIQHSFIRQSRKCIIFLFQIHKFNKAGRDVKENSCNIGVLVCYTFSGGSISYKSDFQIAFSERSVNFTPSIQSCFLSTLRSGAQKQISPSPPLKFVSIQFGI